ncbi:hypothetical protein ACLGI4_22720 [Streptomyces sp. HMX112]|uniref:hypothetical protein n=1 Tax=Streptomyces sp. HMX112 TaxID=3390850 RepID=UPI003A80EF7C
MKTSRLIVSGVVTLAAALPVALTSSVAYADETHQGSDNGPRIALISTGQIDDPLEDVLEHATVLGATHMTENSAG